VKESAVGVMTRQCECGMCRVASACRQSRDTPLMCMRCHGAVMVEESAVMTPQCECGKCRVASACRHLRDTPLLRMRYHGAVMTAESAVGVMQGECECGTCPAVSVCGPPMWAPFSTSVLLRWTWLFGQPPFMLSRKFTRSLESSFY